MKLLIPLKLDVDLNSRGTTKVAAIIKTRTVAAQRAAVAFAFGNWKARAMLAHLRESNPSDVWVVVMTRLSPRTLDDDNLAGRLKAVRDQVAQELGINDRDRQRLLFVPEQRFGKPEAVEVELLPRQVWLKAEVAKLKAQLRVGNARSTRSTVPPLRLPTRSRGSGGGRP